MVGLVETEIATIAGAEIDKVTPVKGKGSKTSGFKKPKSGEGQKLKRNKKRPAEKSRGTRSKKPKKIKGRNL